MTVTLYGIKTCDTVAKARRWLDAAGLAGRYEVSADAAGAWRIRFDHAPAAPLANMPAAANWLAPAKVVRLIRHTSATLRPAARAVTA